MQVDLRSKKKPEIEKVLLEIVECEKAGNPDGGQKWICRSLRRLQRALLERESTTSHETIRRLLCKHDIRAKSNVKRVAPKSHPDRDKQFHHIKSQRVLFEKKNCPIISIDSKKKEKIGNFKNEGKIWSREGEAVYMYDFMSYAEGKAIPYGVYDLKLNRGYMYLGLSYNTPDFAVSCISHWWEFWGAKSYPECKQLLILADGGGSNGYRPRRWKQQLQILLADAFGIEVTVCHYPTGASKWNPIEHRLFNEISKTWAGTPLSSIEVMTNCILDTETITGLKVEAVVIDKNIYERGLKVADSEMHSLSLEKHDICPAWNYTISPR